MTTLELIRRLTAVHIVRYAKLVEIGNDPTHPIHRNIRLMEAKHLLAIWRSIEAKGYDWLRLSDAERHEVEDAAEDAGLELPRMDGGQ